MKYFIVWIALLFPLTPYAQINKKVVEDYYDINGTTAEELRQNLNANGIADGNQSFDAYTHWNIRFHYKYDRSDDECRLTNIQVDLNIEYDLPHWENHHEGDAELRHQWQTYMENLRTHEDGHANHGLDAAEEVNNMLEALPAMENCDELNALANVKANKIIEEYSAKGVTYDHETDHGATQGARFP